MQSNNGRTLWAAACCLMLILAAGCAALPSITEKQEPLDERVKQYMQAQIERKWSIAYTFLDSSSREDLTRDSYLGRTRKLSNKAFSIEEITMLPSGDQAKVKVKTDVSYMGFTFKGVSQTQTWVREKGAWFVKVRAESPKAPYINPEKPK